VAHLLRTGALKGDRATLERVTQGRSLGSGEEVAS
jgi:hypothetical protein